MSHQTHRCIYDPHCVGCISNLIGSTLVFKKMHLKCLNFRTKLEDAETALGIVRRDVDLLSDKEVPALIKDSAAHQVTKILRGDYDLKIARQDYFVSNQDKVQQQIRQYINFESLIGGGVCQISRLTNKN